MTTTDEIKDKMDGVSAPWWIKDDRALLERMRNSIKGKPESAMVRYSGDQRPQTVEQVRIDMDCLQNRIARDIARFAEVGGDYDRM